MNTSKIIKLAAYVVIAIFFAIGFAYAGDYQDSDNPNIIVGGVNPETGTAFVPSGDGGLINTKTGTYFAPAGESGVVNTKTGKYVVTPDKEQEEQKQND